MGKVDCFEIAGLELWFHSSDHLPEHFHAYKPDQWEIRVYFLECIERSLVFDLLGDAGPRKGDRGDLLNAVLAHRDELKAEWERKVKKT